MKIKFLRSSLRDLWWWQTYYSEVFPAGRSSAERHYKTVLSLLRANPYLGHPTEHENLRELAIPRVPFSVIYRVTDDAVEVARLVDQRSNRANKDPDET